jgi:hypothetical protein
LTCSELVEIIAGIVLAHTEMLVDKNRLSPLRVSRLFTLGHRLAGAAFNAVSEAIAPNLGSPR